MRLPVAELGVGFSKKIPPGSFRALNNAYLKDDFVGRRVMVDKTVSFKAGDKLYAGSIIVVVRALKDTFQARLLTGPDGSTDTNDKTYQLYYEYNKQLFEGVA